MVLLLCGWKSCLLVSLHRKNLCDPVFEQGNNSIGFLWNTKGQTESLRLLLTAQYHMNNYGSWLVFLTKNVSAHHLKICFPHIYLETSSIQKTWNPFFKNFISSQSLSSGLTCAKSKNKWHKEGLLRRHYSWKDSQVNPNMLKGNLL